MRITIKTLAADDWSVWRELRLQALKEAPYAFSSTSADWQGEGDREQRWRDRLQSVTFNLVAFLDNEPAGIVSANTSEAKNEAELLSMWVAPWARGRGVGDALIKGVLEWAAANQCHRLLLRVFEDNGPAMALYRRHGFVETGIDSAPDGRRENVMTAELSSAD